MSTAPEHSHSLDLQVRDLSVAYGNVRAVQGVSLDVPSGSVVAVLGANGAGKSSTLRAFAGASAGRVKGEVLLLGRNIAGWRSHRIVKNGMVLVPEGRQVVAPLTVEENLLLGAYRERSPKRVKATLSEVRELFPVLFERRDSPAGLLSGGEQQMLAFGRAMMAQPRIILMDEPSMGLSPRMVDAVMEAILVISNRGSSILLVEQNATAALQVAEYAYVLDQGRIVSAGPAKAVAGDERVADAFLGLREEDVSID